MMAQPSSINLWDGARISYPLFSLALEKFCNPVCFTPLNPSQKGNFSDPLIFSGLFSDPLNFSLKISHPLKDTPTGYPDLKKTGLNTLPTLFSFYKRTLCELCVKTFQKLRRTQILSI